MRCVAVKGTFRKPNQAIEIIGAGEGNRTLVFSLEGCCSTIELHPRAGDELSRHGEGLNRQFRSCRPQKSPGFDPSTGHAELVHPSLDPCLPSPDAGSVPIFRVPPTTKGGDPVSYTQRYHLAGIAAYAR